MTVTSSSPILEVCVDSHAGLRAAIEGGADRIELCAALDLGGLSPSLALLEAARTSPVPVYAMVRPRPGDFIYSNEEIAGMCAEIAQIRQIGLAGVVFGAGSEDGLDGAALARLAAAADGMGRTLHRVVDQLADRQPVLAIASKLGFERVLTSGGAPKAIDGLDDIVSLANAAPDGLSIMPGGGITPDNVSYILRKTGASQVHASARKEATGALKTDGRVKFGGDRWFTDRATVQALQQAIDLIPYSSSSE
ncbi:MAG: copper homeostasis protein CutC [Pseudomonadota bacterium]